jgi:hypothetical protein
MHRVLLCRSMYKHINHGLSNVDRRIIGVVMSQHVCVCERST